jgi:hypothetical protein
VETAHTNYHLAVATILPLLLIAVGLQLPVSEWKADESASDSLRLLTVVLALAVGEFAALDALYGGHDSVSHVLIVSLAISWSILAIIGGAAVRRARVLLARMPHRRAEGVRWGLLLVVVVVCVSDVVFGTRLILPAATVIIFVLAAASAFDVGGLRRRDGDEVRVPIRMEGSDAGRGGVGLTGGCPVGLPRGGSVWRRQPGSAGHDPRHRPAPTRRYEPFIGAAFARICRGRVGMGRCDTGTPL